MHADYGYINGSVGKDGDHLDVFLGPDLESEVVFIIDQINKDGTFDEHKIVIGTKNRVEAIALYLSNYSKGWKCGPVSSLTLEDFKAWVASGETGSMYSKQKKTASSAVDLLVQAKDASDRRDYGQKKNIMAALLREKPDEFFVDSDKDGIVGITHRPSGFQIHVTKDTVPHGISSQIPVDSTTKASDLVTVGGNQKQVLSTEMGRKVAEALRQISEVKPLPPIGGMMKGDAVASEKRSMVLEQLGRMEIDPEISMRNLGSEKANMDPDMLADIATKLLKINRGEASVDDRDDKANQTFHSPDDFFEERILKDAGGVRRTLLFKSRYNGSLKGLKPGHFTGQLDGLVIGNSLSQAIGGINPVELFDSRFRVTQIGDGGIGSKDSIPLAARDVHPSQLGVIDPIRSPESGMVGIDQRLSGYARKGPNNQVYFPLIDRKTGKQVWRTPSQIHGKVVMFPKFRNQE
jgi:DNA-directed RNA polymerase beta subunit